VNVTAAGAAIVDCGERVRVVTVDAAANATAGNAKATVSRAARARPGLRRCVIEIRLRAGNRTFHIKRFLGSHSDAVNAYVPGDSNGCISRSENIWLTYVPIFDLETPSRHNEAHVISSTAPEWIHKSRQVLE
jgi:hypothetical protein